MKDWMIRALKTFVQTFGGVLIPVICSTLAGTLPEDISGWKAVLIPAVCAALSAAIAAVWNIILEYLKKEYN